MGDLSGKNLKGGLRSAVHSVNRMGNFRIAIPGRGCKLAIRKRDFQGRNADAAEMPARGLFLKEIFKCLAGIARPREARSGEADGPDAGADGAVSFSMVVRNS